MRLSSSPLLWVSLGWLLFSRANFRLARKLKDLCQVSDGVTLSLTAGMLGMMV